MDCVLQISLEIKNPFIKGKLGQNCVRNVTLSKLSR